MSDGEFSAHEKLLMQEVVKAVMESLRSTYPPDRYGGSALDSYFKGMTPEMHITHHNEMANQQTGAKTWEEIKKELIIWMVKTVLVAAAVGALVIGRHYILGV